MNKTLYVGLDVHKDTIAVAVADEGRLGEIRFYAVIVNSADAVLRLTKTLTQPLDPVRPFGRRSNQSSPTIIFWLIARPDNHSTTDIARGVLPYPNLN